MGDALFGSKPALINAQGSSLGGRGAGVDDPLQAVGTLSGEKDPLKRLTMLQNWLTAGGPPKPIDPGQIFAEEGTVAAQKEKGGAGQGFAGLFGFGKFIGDLAPPVPLNTSPMQPGVPYAAPPMPGGK